MFGIGFTEILIIFVIAILFLGPDKLPSAMIEMAKFIKTVKKTIGEAKSSLEEEMKVADLKEEALNYKKQLDDATNELKSFKNIDIDEIVDNENKKKKKAVKAEYKSASQVEQKNDTVTFKKKSEKVAEKKKPKAKKSDKKKVASETNTKKSVSKTATKKSIPKKSIPKKPAPKKTVSKKPDSKKSDA